MYAPIIIGKVARINIQMAKILPNFFVVPSAFVDVKSTKYPTIIKTVAGNKLK